MATREELIEGLELLIREGRRIGDQLSEDDWAKAVDLDGWKNKQILSHVAAVGGMVAPMAGGLTAAPAGSDAMASIDIDALNAASVAQREGKSIPELVAEVETAYRGVIEWVKSAPQETLDRRVTVRGYVEVPLSEIIVRMVILHGLAHIYSAYSAVMMSTGGRPQAATS
jgi:hypothetical protein